MILADTSIWIDHFRQPDPTLIELIRTAELLIHPFVIGELAMGNLANRERILFELDRLPSLLPSRHGEVLTLIDTHRLSGSGIGWTDAHLLCAVRLLPGCRLLTRDRRLRRGAEILGLVADL